MTADRSIQPAHSTFTPLTSTDPAAIAVIRAAGPAFEAFARAHLDFASGSVLAQLTAGAVRRAVLHETDGEPIDDLVVSVRSAGPDWDVWLHLHGGSWIPRRCGELLAAAGFVFSTPSGPSIFPADAPLKDAIAERLPAMLTLAGVRWLVSQAEVLPPIIRRLAVQANCHPRLVRRACACLADTVRIFDWYARPLRIALIGPPNAGKSTLFNRLVGAAVSITSPRPGTTRDWVEAPAELGGFPVTWIDTAGVFEATDPLDAAGMAATAAANLSADLQVTVLDATNPAPNVGAFAISATGRVPNLVVINKTDAAITLNVDDYAVNGSKIRSIVRISAINGIGIDELCSRVLHLVGRTVPRASKPAVFTPVQAERARAASHCTDCKLLRNMILRILE